MYLYLQDAYIWPPTPPGHVYISHTCCAFSFSLLSDMPDNKATIGDMALRHLSLVSHCWWWVYHRISTSQKLASATGRGWNCQSNWNFIVNICETTPTRLAFSQAVLPWINPWGTSSPVVSRSESAHRYPPPDTLPASFRPLPLGLKLCTYGTVLSINIDIGKLPFVDHFS